MNNKLVDAPHTLKTAQFVCSIEISGGGRISGFYQWKAKWKRLPAVPPYQQRIPREAPFWFLWLGFHDPTWQAAHWINSVCLLSCPTLDCCCFLGIFSGVLYKSSICFKSSYLDWHSTGSLIAIPTNIRKANSFHLKSTPVSSSWWQTVSIGRNSFLA